MLRFLFTIIAAMTLCQTANSHQYVKKFEGFFKEYEGRKLDLIKKFLPENPTVIEAGGHYGEDTVKLSKKWPEGTIISFEPNPNAFEKLQKTVEGIKNIWAYNLAINDYNGVAVLNVCYGTNGDNPIFEGASSLLEASDCMEQHYQGPKVSVPCAIVDDWCAQNHIDQIDFAWFDLEGLELQVLKASPELVRNLKVIYTETNFFPFRKGMTNYHQLKSFLTENGFKLLAHWYLEGLQGDAIFVKEEIFNLAFEPN